MTRPALRVALFSGNYNYVRDGANQALNRLVDYLLRQGVVVRVYSPTTDTPAFPPAGDLVSVPSRPFPLGRSEYRYTFGMPTSIRADLASFAPDIVHVSAPDALGHRAISWARDRGIPVVASLHTRFETYFQYYGLAWMVPLIEAIQRRFYARASAVLVPSESMADEVRKQDPTRDCIIWARGIDTGIFTPAARDMAWRREHGLADTDVVIGFLGRLVMEKGLDVFAQAVAALRHRGVAHKVLVIGDGPARDWFAEHLPGAVFAGFQSGSDLGRAVAAMDVMFNPSITETFGNVTLEAMACGVPVVAANATGSANLVKDGVTGTLVPPGNVEAFADALALHVTDEPLRRERGQAAEAESRHYDWDRINQIVLDTYQALVKP